MVVYIDIYFLENFIVNLFLLLITFRILRYEYRKKVIYGAAILGAAYSILLFIKDLTILTSLPVRVIVAFIMIAITCNGLSIKGKIKATMIYFIGSFTLAGVCFGASLMTNEYSIFENFTITNTSIKTILISAILFYIVITRIGEYIRDKNIMNNFIYDIEIPMESTKLMVKAYLDTGNCLKEPITNLPCIILENDIFNMLKKNEDECFHIAYNTIGDSGTMIGIKSDKVRINNNGREWKTIDVILCGCKNKLSEDNEFNALLSRGVI